MIKMSVYYRVFNVVQSDKNEIDVNILRFKDSYYGKQITKSNLVCKWNH